MKRSGKLLLLTGIAIVVLIAAVISSQRKVAMPDLERKPLLPDFKGVVNETGELLLRSGDRALTIVRKDDQWLIAEAENYAADIAKIRKILIEVANLRIIEEKTSNPDRYAILGVEDPNSEQAESVALEIKNTSGSQQASLIVGKRQLSGSAGANPGRYVRLAGEKQVLLVTGPLEVPTEVSSWIDGELLKIDPARVREVRIEHPDGSKVELSTDADNGDMVLANLPAGKEEKAPAVLNRMKDVLQNITIENVMKGDAAALPAPHTITTVGTADGLVARIESGPIKDSTWVSFNFVYDRARVVKTATVEDTAAANDAADKDPAAPEKQPLDVEKETAELQVRTAGWLFRLPEYQLELLTRTLDQVSQDQVSDSEQKED